MYIETDKIVEFFKQFHILFAAWFTTVFVIIILQ